MQVVQGIAHPLPGERPLEVVPPLAPYVSPGSENGSLRRRLNLFPQRALTHVALSQEQGARMLEGTLLAQAVAPGVVDGFEVALSRTRLGAQLFISPGHGVTTDGNDIELAYPLRLDADAIPVHGASLAGWTTPDDGSLHTRAGAGENIALAEFVHDAGTTSRGLLRAGLLPHALVLVAQPVAVAITATDGEVAAAQNATDEVLSEDLAWEDGFRLLWVAWPASRPLPPWTRDGQALDTRFRNRLAYAVFDEERRPAEATGTRSVRRMTEPRTEADPPAPRRRGEPPAPPLQQPWPWEVLGVPLSIVGFDGAFRPAFADRAAVVRQGGGRRNRAPLLSMSGDDVLWQARVSQMLEHLSELEPEQRRASRLARHFDRLPPAGLLPLDTVNFLTRRQDFFPPQFDVQVQPVPLEMVDALLAESAPLAALNVDAAEQVQMLVPVPARYYDPDLLNLDERINPLFDIEARRLEDERLRLLRRRDALRRRVDLLGKVIDGQLPAYPEDDPNALPDERGALDGMAFARVRVVQVINPNTWHWHGFSAAQARLTLTEAHALMVFVQVNSPVKSLALRMRLPGGTVAGFVWGERSAVNPQELTQQLALAGPLPTDANGKPITNQWMRLTAPVSLLGRNASNQVVPNPLVGVALDNMEFGVQSSASGGVAVTWGYAGSVFSGNESYWVADAWPMGADPKDSIKLWRDDVSGVSEAENHAWGVSVDATHVTFAVDEVKALQDLVGSMPGGLMRELGLAWPRPAWSSNPNTPAARSRAAVLVASPRPPLVEQGLNALIDRLDTLASAADDHVEIGFLRARTDVFRLRQGVLGTSMAARLLTSPSAADLVQRAESATVADTVFADYFARAKSRV